MAPIKLSPQDLLSRAGKTRAPMKLMFLALKVGDVPTMDFLLNEGRLHINARSRESGDTLLHAAVVYGRCVTVIRRLVRAGCRIDAADKTGDTALHLAVRFHKIHVAVELIRLGANVCARNRDGETPLQLAVANKSHVDVLKIIPDGDEIFPNFYGLATLRLATAAERRPRDWIPDLVASYEGKTIYNEELRGLVKMLLDAGADVNARDANGCSPIQCAVYTGDLELVKTLIDAGADLDNRNRRGCAALHDAVLCCNETMVYLLLSRGAEVNVQTEGFNQTALHWALELDTDNNRNGIIRWLIEFGCNLDHKDIEGDTPFQLILQIGDVDLVTFLVDQLCADKADLNKFEWDGSNALAFAAQNLDERVMDSVLQRSPRLEINHRCEDQVTPLHHASRLSLLGNVRWLISRGADVNAKDSLDQTPLYYCVDRLSAFDELTDARANYAEERRQVMILLLECGADVNDLVTTLEENKQTVLELAIALNDIDEWKVIIKYAAEFEAKTEQPFFDGHNLRAIEKNPEVESYHQKCRAELTAMRTAKIEGSFVSYLSVLTQRLDVVARYTRNDELVENLRFTLQSNAYPIYASQLRKRFDEAIVRRIRVDRAFAVLSETMQFADLTDSILENIFKYLNEDDVDLLNDIALKRKNKC